MHKNRARVFFYDMSIITHHRWAVKSAFFTVAVKRAVRGRVLDVFYIDASAVHGRVIVFRHLRNLAAGNHAAVGGCAFNCDAKTLCFSCIHQASVSELGQVGASFPAVRPHCFTDRDILCARLRRRSARKRRPCRAGSCATRGTTLTLRAIRLCCQTTHA